MALPLRCPWCAATVALAFHLPEVLINLCQATRTVQACNPQLVCLQLPSAASGHATATICRQIFAGWCRQVLGPLEKGLRSAAELGAWQLISPVNALGRVLCVDGLHEIQDEVRLPHWLVH